MYIKDKNIVVRYNIIIHIWVKKKKETEKKWSDQFPFQTCVNKVGLRFGCILRSIDKHWSVHGNKRAASILVFAHLINEGLW